MALPSKGSPFEGISGTKAPARSKKTPDLTGKVALAKAKKQALTHGGLFLTPQQEKTASEAGKALAAHKKVKQAATSPKRTPQTVPKAPAAKPAGVPTTLPLPNTAPFKVPPPSAPAPNVSPRVPSPGRRGAPLVNPREQLQAEQPKQGSLLGGIRNAASVGLGTALETAASVPGTLMTPIRPGATSTPAEKVKPTHLAPALQDTTKRLATASNAAASGLQGAGLSLPKTIPSVDLVPSAGAASKTTYTPQALVAAGLSEKQTTLFRKRALKQGWYQGEIDGLVGLDLIKHAYSKPPPMALRVLQNFGAGVIRTGALANVPVALGKEVASGHGLRAAKEFGNIAASQLGGLVEHPVQSAVSDPYTFVPVAGGVTKTIGGIGGKVAEKLGREAVTRDVALASTGAVVNRGVRDRNLYNATGQAVSDAAAARFPAVARKVESKAVDKLVADVSNETAPLHHGVQVAYAKAFKKVGAKRAELLSSINKAGGKPEKILAKYTADGNARQVKHWTQVVAASKNLTEKDHAFLQAHRELGAQTTATHVGLGRFSDTAGIYRAHQPLILSDAHAGDPAAQRVQALHDEWTKALRTTDDQTELAPLFGAYDHAVREYAQGHLGAGGFEPTRVAYTPPPATGAITSPYTKGSGGRVRFNARVPRQKASTGGSFESGNYLIDPKVALRENLQAQRLRTSVGLTSDENLAKIGAIKAERGDERPHGYVFTPSQNPATVGKVISDLHDQPVGAHDYYHQESTVRDRLAKHLEASADTTGEHAAQPGWFVPEGAWNRILDYTRPESRFGYDKFMRQYQRAMISIFPSTVLGNTVGSVPLALAAGAGPKSFAKAAESSRDASLVPYSIHGRGVAGNLAADARNPLTAGMNKMRAANVKGEDFSRDAAYFSKALKGADKRAKELGYDDTNGYLRDMASGKVDPDVRDQAIAHAIKFAGDAAKPATKTTRRLGRVVLFPAWLQHMTTLMLKTLPIEHPRRLALINAMAAYGDQYRKEHGALPTWMQEFAPLFTHTMGGQEFTQVAGLGQLAPQGTAGGVFDQLSQSQPFTDRLIGLTNPPVAAGLHTALQIHDNPKSAYPVDMKRYIENQLLYTVPGMSKFFPRTGMEPDSLPWSPRRYTIPYKDPDGNSVQVPWAMRPGARPEGGALGIASRVLGLPLYNVPTPDSVINKRTNATAIYKAKHPPKKN